MIDRLLWFELMSTVSVIFFKGFQRHQYYSLDRMTEGHDVESRKPNHESFIIGYFTGFEQVTEIKIGDI